MLNAANYEAVVYVDVVLTVNFVMDFFILWAAGKLANLKYTFPRLVWGAAFGALYSLVLFLPEYSFLTTLAGKVACSLVMALLAYAPLAKAAFIRAVGCLYIVSFAMGGAVIASIYLTNPASGSISVFNGTALLTGDFDYLWLSVGLGVAILLGYSGMVYLRKNWFQQSLVKEIVVGLMGRQIRLSALLDTGNQLVEPLSQLPVVVVEAGAMRNYLPANLFTAVISSDDIILSKLTAQLDPEWSARLRMIPFNSVGRTHGLMLGVRPDYIEVRKKNGNMRLNSAVIGLVNRVLSKEGKYEALLHPQLAQDVF